MEKIKIPNTASCEGIFKPQTETVATSREVLNSVRAIKILLFYKFVEMKDPERFVEEHGRFCEDLGIKGKILVAKEGINGSVSGTMEQVEKYKTELWRKKEFEDIVFKEEEGLEHPFERMVVRTRDYIINIGKDVDLNKKGRYIKSDELVKLYESGEDFVIVDGRNNYESEIGKFKGAVTPNIENFREFDKVVEQLRGFENKKIVTYCTGGIRCEKASAMLVENGFHNVYQLEGGVITFCQNFPNTFWEGSCFVFDKRLVSKVGQETRPITKCRHCLKESDFYRNCRNKECDELMIVCDSCDSEMRGCCSEECFGKVESSFKEKEIKNRGKYSKENP
ncbi:MAG: rhodanese-related sulfurtransferase [Nanoarchaeota archaeon]